ncbi:MAG TPA: glycoside hydrolase domain-containing protein [Phycisphaerae bacterium]|nr:glycoside hydrolase domain-containing protein [Phycisphaerae bacterium]
MTSRVVRTMAAMVCLACLCVLCVAEGPATAQAQQSEVVVLDTMGYWRLHHTLAPPVIQLGGELKPVLFEQEWLNRPTSPPPASWAQAAFDDGGWLRCPARRGCWTPYLSRLCLRGKFEVTDPAKVQGLSLSLEYHGGAVVHVNGKELARGHLRPDALAEPYPREAFLTSEGELTIPRSGRAKTKQEAARWEKLRTRRLEDVRIPSGQLRKGVNVVAIEIIRAPYHAVLEEKKIATNRGAFHELSWNTCEIRQVRLTASSAEGLVPNATRPKGLQVWNADVLAGDFDLDYGDRCEPVRPVEIVGAANGSFSGKVMLGSTEPIRGLKVTVGDLTGEGAKIPASAVRIRYGIPWGQEATFGSGWRAPVLAALAEAPLDEFPVRKGSASGRELAPVWGAVVPIWVTVKVPATARPGTYAGQIEIRTEGAEPLRVAVRMKVVGWALPYTQDYRTWVELMQSPDTLAVEYGVPLWSDKHFELIGRSMRFLNEVGSRVLYVPLICRTNLGNEQSMVRWIDRGGGRYEYDFSVMERDLDVALEHMGTPKIVCFNVWDVYLIPQSAHDANKKSRMVRSLQATGAGEDRLGTGPMVSLLDPAANTIETVYLPRYESPASKALWQPLMAALRSRLKKRRLEKAMMLGMIPDHWPTEQEVRFFKEVAPGLPWVAQGHGRHEAGGKLRKMAEVGYQACVWGTRFADGVKRRMTDPNHGRLYGWKLPDLIAKFERLNLDVYPTTRWRHLGEVNITGDQRGIGRIGADFWDAVKDKRGGRAGPVWRRYPEGHWMNLVIQTSLLAPGPDGPVATNRYEAFREGVQECEARIFIERALTDETLRARLGPDLAARCQQALDERLVFIWKGLSNLHVIHSRWGDKAYWWRSEPGIAGHAWFLGSGWQKRSELLYAIAGEVAAKLGGN